MYLKSATLLRIEGLFFTAALACEEKGSQGRSKINVVIYLTFFSNIGRLTWSDSARTAVSYPHTHSFIYLFFCTVIMKLLIKYNKSSF